MSLSNSHRCNIPGKQKTTGIQSDCTTIDKQTEKKNKRCAASAVAGSALNYVGERSPGIRLLQNFDDIVSSMNIPGFLRENKGTLRFPEILLLLIVQAEREALKRGQTTAKASITWTQDGGAIIVRDTKELAHIILPLAACQAKFSSLVRRMYRWGFRQVSNSFKNRHHENVKEKVFCHPLFQRDNKLLIADMASITAESTRRAIAAQHLIGIQETCLSDQVDRQERIQTMAACCGSPPFTTHCPPPSLSPVESLSAEASIPSSEQLATGQTLQFPAPALGISNEHNQISLELALLLSGYVHNRWPSLMNQQQVAPAAELGIILPYNHALADYFVSGQQQAQLLLLSRTPPAPLRRGANIMSFSRPLLMEENTHERTRAALRSILGSSLHSTGGEQFF